MAGIAGLAWQVIIPQLVNKLGPAFPRDLLHNWAGEHLRAENGRDSGFPDLVNQAGHFPGPMAR